jgi:hypothetical protein
VYKGNPLKNVGFHINRGAKPHLTKIENNNTNQIRPNENISRVVFTLTKKRKNHYEK